MKSTLIIFIVLGVIVPSAFCVTATLGVATSVTANTQTEFTFLGGLITLDIMVNADTQLTLSPYFSANFTVALAADGAATISNGFTIATDATFSFGTSLGAGLKLTFSNNAKIVNSATLTIPFDIASIIGNFNFGILQWDTNAMAYCYLPATSGGLLSAQFTFTDAGIFLTVQYDKTAGVKFPSLFSQSLTISSTSTSFSFPNGVFIDVAGSSNTFNVTFSTQNPEPNSPSNHASAGKYIDITLTTAANVTANVSFAYNSTFNPNFLSIAFYDTTSASWVFPTSGLSIDTNTQVIIQATTHFSTWGMYYSSAPKLTVAWAAIILVCALLL